MAYVIISLGSNVGDRERNLARAVDALARETTLHRRSSVYESSPVGYTDQDDFLNMAVKLETDRGPEQLLELTQRIEHDLGREKGERWGPRVIDIDIISYDDIVVAKENLIIPHPRLHERLFVLLPLKEVSPSWRHPILREPPQGLISAVSGRQKAVLYSRNI